MPIYEYACTACGERTEAKQTFDDPPLETCEICGGKLRKLYSPVGVVFKGSGFYSTDAKRSSKSTASPSKDTSSSTKAATSGSGDSGSSSKAETKKDPSPSPSAKKESS
jgi:putative FmdB family regulatory protein